VTTPIFRDSLSFVGWARTCYVSTCNEEMKGNAKCQNSRFEPPFGDLWVSHTVHLWLDGKRIFDFC